MDKSSITNSAFSSLRLYPAICQWKNLSVLYHNTLKKTVALGFANQKQAFFPFGPERVSAIVSNTSPARQLDAWPQSHARGGGTCQVNAGEAGGRGGVVVAPPDGASGWGAGERVQLGRQRPDRLPIPRPSAPPGSSQPGRKTTPAAVKPVRSTLVKRAGVASS